MANSKRGRKPAAALALVSVQEIPRAKAPNELTREQGLVWDAVMAAQPADWFNGGTKPMLVQFCRHVIEARDTANLIQTLKQKISEMAAEGGDFMTLLLSATEAIDKLTKMQERESRAIASLATKMRITQQSTINQRGNAIEAKKPWDF